MADADVKGKDAWKVIVISVVLMFALGLAIGYLTPRDVRVQVIEASGKYVNYFNMMNDYIHPFNETDNITMFYHGSTLIINHTTPNEYGIRFFDVGFDGNGYITYVTQLRER